MGDKQSKQSEPDANETGAVDFNHFEVLRSIGKGSFGKVCIVKKKKSPDDVFAMKYMNKLTNWKQGTIENILRELYILSQLDHPFLVNLWFTFQDEEDIFMVSDLLLGGDLRYHINKHVTFSDNDIRTYLWEMASVLDYLKSKCIVHRDVKPDNILLDDKGHVHLTDFNTATVLSETRTRTSTFAGTMPYTAPEMHQAALGLTNGYAYSVDWWSLGVTIYELMRHKRPFDINFDTSHSDCLDVFKRCSISFPVAWPQSLKTLCFSFFEFSPDDRISSFDSLCKMEFCPDGNLKDVIDRKVSPNFLPSQTELNYDPTYELEEMIIESNPLHKKKHRLTKRQKTLEKLKAKKSDETTNAEAENSETTALRAIEDRFIPFNRERLNTDQGKGESTGNIDKEKNNGSDKEVCDAYQPEMPLHKITPSETDAISCHQ